LPYYRPRALRQKKAGRAVITQTLYKACVSRQKDIEIVSARVSKAQHESEALIERIFQGLCI